MQVDHPRVVAGRLQDGHLVGDFYPAVTTSPPLPEELGGEHFARGLLHTAFDHGKLPPAAQRQTWGGDVTNQRFLKILKKRLTQIIQ